MRDEVVGLVAYGAACLLCVIPLNFVFAGTYLLLAAGEGMPLIDRMVQAAHPGAPGAFFYVSMLVWAAATWYSAQLVLERHPAPMLAIWMPRLLGVLIYPPLTAYFLRVGQASQMIAVTAIAAAWLACVVKWHRAAPGTRTVLALLAAVTLAHALLAGYLLSRTALPRFTGMAPVVLLAFASWTLVASLVYALLPKRYRLI